MTEWTLWGDVWFGSDRNSVTIELGEDDAETFPPLVEARADVKRLKAQNHVLNTGYEDTETNQNLIDWHTTRYTEMHAMLTIARTWLETLEPNPTVDSLIDEITETLKGDFR